MKNMWKWLWAGMISLCLLLFDLLLFWKTFGMGADSRVYQVIILVLAAFFGAVQLVVLIKNLFLPLQKLHRLMEFWPSSDRKSILKDVREIGGAVHDTARLMAKRMEELEIRAENSGNEAARQTELDTRRKMAEEICISALPRVIGKLDGRENFEISGYVERIGQPSCSFYDYFAVDSGSLGVVVGKVPDQSVSGAMFLVMTQTMIRSRMRAGRSLVETMADVNAQLYDLGAQNVLNAFVGILNTKDGWFTFVNAGQHQPWVMRNEEGYALADIPRYAPLGQNEQVTYQTRTLRLRQGERIFLHTQGLAQCCDSNNVPFGSNELRSALNRSRRQNAEPGDTLRYMANEAAAYCTSDAAVQGYAALLLEYRKGDRDLAHVESPAVPSGAGSVAEFLKTLFSQNGIEPKRYAKIAVVADEMFALCCRHLPDYAFVTTECGLAPDGEGATIRMSAPLNGVNPMEACTTEMEQSAVDFINAQADFTSFKQGKEKDTLTAVCFWS